MFISFDIIVKLLISVSFNKLIYKDLIMEHFHANLTRGPRATGRSPEWHSECRYADVM